MRTAILVASLLLSTVARADPDALKTAEDIERLEDARYAWHQSRFHADAFFGYRNLYRDSFVGGGARLALGSSGERSGMGVFIEYFGTAPLHGARINQVTVGILFEWAISRFRIQIRPRSGAFFVSGPSHTTWPLWTLTFGVTLGSAVDLVRSGAQVLYLSVDAGADVFPENGANAILGVVGAGLGYRY